MKKLSTKLIIFFGLIGFLIFPTLNASAGMGGHGSGGQGGSNAGHMGGNTGGEQDSHHFGSGHMDQAMAERMIHQYMQNHSPGSYEMGEIKDEGSYYMTDIVRPKTGARERLRIDKRTGNIRQIR